MKKQKTKINCKKRLASKETIKDSAELKRLSSQEKKAVPLKEYLKKRQMISPEELETLKIKAGRKLLQSIMKAKEDIKAGRFYSHKDVFKRIKR